MRQLGFAEEDGGNHAVGEIGVVLAARTETHLPEKDNRAREDQRVGDDRRMAAGRIVIDRQKGHEPPPRSRERETHGGRWHSAVRGKWPAPAAWRETIANHRRVCPALPRTPIARETIRQDFSS